VKNRVLNMLLGDRKEAMKRISYPDLAILLDIHKTGTLASAQTTASKDPSSTQQQQLIHNLTDWKNDYYDKKLPVKPTWAIQCLTEMEGEDFTLWLQRLSCLETGSSSTLSVVASDANAKGKKFSVVIGIPYENLLYILAPCTVVLIIKYHRV
jgi:hypothetical protein